MGPEDDVIEPGTRVEARVGVDDRLMRGSVLYYEAAPDWYLIRFDNRPSHPFHMFRGRVSLLERLAMEAEGMNTCINCGGQSEALLRCFKCMGWCDCQPHTHGVGPCPATCPVRNCERCKGTGRVSDDPSFTGTEPESE